MRKEAELWIKDSDYVPSNIYDESSAKEALEKAKEIKKWIKKNL